jgi:pimeloyl-ACP methyl ester carboxylesterase
VVLEGLGHMTAIEDPERTSDELLSFLASLT